MLEAKFKATGQTAVMIHSVSGTALDEEAVAVSGAGDLTIVQELFTNIALYISTENVFEI